MQTSVLQTALAHRSIRKFKAQAVPADSLRAVLEAGQAASSSSFMQIVSIIRVSDPAIRAQIRPICAAGGKGGQVYVETAPEFIVFCADTTRYAHFAPDAQLDWTEVLLIGAVDVGIFAQNVLLAAESMGLGGVFIGSIRNDLAQVGKLLGCPQGVVPIVGMCLGYPDQEPMRRERLPLDAILSENRFQAAPADALQAYNDNVQAYYRTRDGVAQMDWAQQIRNQFCREVRPDLLRYLQAQGFAKR